MSEEVPHADSLLVRAAAGDAAAWGSLLSFHQDRLYRIVEFRMDRRLRRRLDVADVMQETFIAATARRAEFFRQSAQPLFLWLRWMVGNTMLQLHRHHLGAQMRDARREMHSDCLPAGACLDDDSRAALVERLTGGGTGPATAARTRGSQVAAE
jgi:RNA polymerase sigma-70 factor (ECF subfamily)